MGRLRWLLVGASHRFTLWIGIRYGHTFPMYFVCGFPRSGTNWFSELLADYLNLPRPRNYIFPIGFASIIQTHAKATYGLDDCFYIVRDGRDCLVSKYFKLVKILAKDKNFVYQRRYQKLFGSNFKQENNGKNLALFAKDQLRRKKSSWSEHAGDWQEKLLKATNNIVIIRYEDLLENTVEVFTNAVDAKFGTVKHDLIAEAVNRNDFERQKSRPAEHHHTILRRGIASDWRNHFNAECAELFDHYAGTTLVRFGYEKDRSWVSKIA